MLVADRERILAVERNASGEALKGHDAERIDVAPAVQRLCPCLLRTHVMRRADRHAGSGQLGSARRLGDPEVRDDRTVHLVQHDVVRLDVPMDDPVLVRVVKRVRGLRQELPDLGRRQRTPLFDDVRERLAAEQLHHEVDDAVRPPDAIDGDDVGMLELCGGAGFALEALDEILVERQRERKDLDRYFSVELLVAGLEDDGHSPAAQLLEQLPLIFQCFADDVEFSLLDGLAGRQRRAAAAGDPGEVKSAGRAELALRLDFGTAPGAEHDAP